MSTPKFAQKTKVPVSQTRNEIEVLLKRYGATAFMYGQDETAAIVGFRAKDRNIRFRLPVSGHDDPQAERQKWRALLLCVKAKMEAVAGGIATFEDEFLAYTVLPGGVTVGEHIKPRIADAYSSGKVAGLLPDYSK